jgi:hypothetical protein
MHLWTARSLFLFISNPFLSKHQSAYFAGSELITKDEEKKGK